ncbi:MAG: Glycerophosphoryl diester phosphodiesterase [Promethearchaeota archaeon]|nr:MAG: Glycerophosphoryl diester phosphodiesterase [Candidatus Lokiarchaeota archaeon]
MTENRDFLVIAHRGASKEAPENTLKAFEKAIKLGADFVEFDVHLTKDKEVIIIHDEDTYRTTGQKGLVKDMTLKEIKMLQCEGRESIPTLKELIKLAKGKIGLQCEIKAEGLASIIVEMFRTYSLIEESIVSSFNMDELKKVQELEPELRLASLEPTTPNLSEEGGFKEQVIKRAKDLNCYAIHPLYRLIDEQLIALAHENNIRVHPWTVDSTIAMKKLINWGVDGIITNDIRKIQKILEKR